MLSEEALVLYATAAVCVLLVLGVLELLAPTRPRHPQRRAAARDPWRRARTTPAPASARVRERMASSVATPFVHLPPRETAPSSPPPRAEPPIERLLIAQADEMGGPHMAPTQKIGGHGPTPHPAQPKGPTPPSDSPGQRSGHPGEAGVPLDIPRRSGGPDEARPRFDAPPRPAPPAEAAAPPDVPLRSERAGEAAAPLDIALRAGHLSEAMAPVDVPQRSESPGEAGAPVDVPQRSEHPGQAGARLGDAPEIRPVPELGERPLAAGDEPVPAPLEERGPAAPPEPTSLVDRCFALYQSGQSHAVITEAMAALETVRAGALVMEPRETARLWGLVAFARQALGERDGARAALEEALAVAPSDDRATWQRHLAALALKVGQDLVAQAQSGTANPEECVTTLHAALRWLESGLAVAPDDATLREAATAARAALWPTYEQAVSQLLQRQDYQVARRVLRQAQAEENCPTELQNSFREMLASSYGGEVGQLSAEAIKRMQENKEEEALATLDRAEEMLGLIPEGGLPEKRRHELERRLWWSYTKVGIRRVDGGLYEEGLPPLLHALGYLDVGPERREETKGPLIHAIEAIVTIHSPLIERLTAEGDREGALALCEKLWGLLHRALAGGLTREELAVSLARTQSLFEQLGIIKPSP